MKDPIVCLAVDDDIDDLEVFSLVIKSLDQNVKLVTARNGIDALEVINSSTEIPDYIFLDINMPKMNGFDCLKQLKKNPSLEDCEIYMYSTSSEETMVEKSKSLGAKDLVVKPADPRMLKEQLSSIMGTNA